MLASRSTTSSRHASPPSLAITLLWVTTSGCMACSSPPASKPPTSSQATAVKNPAPEAQPAQDEDPSARRASVFVVHQVPDFAAYLRQFQGNAEARAKAGVTRVVLTRLAGDPTRVGLHFSAGSLDSVEKFLAGTNYRQLVEADQATESTVLWIASDELDELPNSIASGTASLFKKFPVTDVECVVAGLTSNQSSLQTQGLLGFSLHRTESNARVAILHLLAPDRATVEKIYEGPLQPLLTGCGADKLERPLVGTNQATP